MRRAIKPTANRCYGPNNWVLLGGCLLAAMTLHSSAASSEALSEREFLQPLTSKHALILAREGELAEAKRAQRRAATLANPTLELEHEAPTDDAAQTTIKLGWRPPLDGRRGLAIEAGAAAVTGAQLKLDWQLLELREEMRAVFADWAVAEQRKVLLARHYEDLRSLEARLSARAEQGEESQLAAHRFALAVSAIRARLARAEAERSQRRGLALRVREGLSPEAVPMLPTLPELPGIGGETPRPDLLAQKSELEAAILRQRLSGRWFEFPSLILGWTRISGSDEDNAGPYIGLSWDAPLFDRNQAGQEHSAKTVSIAQAQLLLAERDAEQRRPAARSAYVALRASVAEVREIVLRAPGVVEAASASFLAGESSMTDLLETLASVLESKLAALDLQAEALAAHREFELSIGRSLTEGDS